MTRTARPQPREKGALAQFYAFVRTMTNEKSSTLQKIIGATVGLTPPLVLLVISVAIFPQVQQLDWPKILLITGGGGLAATGFARGLRRTNRRLAALRGSQESSRETGGEGEGSAAEDGENVAGDSVGT
ncbi:hypothetical protein [Actinophytocola gossypii]|uniref:Uncharacterized protein n=1 Tax=Actinophytocola gossypii TaxID=2812003 RepID=A0ABT2JIP7_9PSEU|nr:hypothetical protein [Actinophytocola gossypii]MCT2587628.1 hypothetical protein [Actinophytocola gossypii]